MESISQIDSLQKSIKNISLNLFQIESALNVVDLLNPLPDNINNLLTDPELLDMVTKADDTVKELNKLLGKLQYQLKKALYKQASSNQPKDEPYAGFKVDEKPLINADLGITEPVYKSFVELNELNKVRTGKDITPVKRKSELPYKGSCPYCNAPNEYLYNNNNGNQCLCKACRNTFNKVTKKYDEYALYCPHCRNKLMVHHDRKNYLVYICRNDKCSYYLESKKKKAQCYKSLKTVSNLDKLRYAHRSFKFTFNQVNSPDKLNFNTKIALSRAHHSEETIGLILTIYVNYGLSSRKTAMMLKDLFGISISHQTIMNYAEAAASLIQNFTINYDYKLGNILCADETYIKVSGKSKYVFFFSDPNSKIITSWKIYDHRDTRNAVESILMSLHRYKGKVPKDLLLITDANPIYNAAQVFLGMNGIEFDLQQVVGVSNKDEVSKTYRPYKQIEERLNRTYKQNYYGTNGYQTLTSANVYMILYVTFFNFLRRHSSLDFKTPVDLDFLKDKPLMSSKWVALINQGAQLI